MEQMANHTGGTANAPTAGTVRSDNLPADNHQNRELFRIRSSRLVDFFPDELVIQEKTISIIRNEFLVSCVETILVKDIGRVVYINTPLFAGLRIIGKNTAHELHIRGLSKDTALHAEKVVEGLLMEDKGVVDIPSWLQPDTRRDMLADAAKHPEHQEELRKKDR